jgi:hypothetical protein
MTKKKTGQLKWSQYNSENFTTRICIKWFRKKISLLIVGKKNNCDNNTGYNVTLLVMDCDSEIEAHVSPKVRSSFWKGMRESTYPNKAKKFVTY